MLHVNKQNLDLAGGVDAGKGDPDEGMFEYATDETEDDVENPDESSEMARVVLEDAITELDDKIIDIPVVQTLQKTTEVPQLQCTDKVVNDPVVQVVHVPQVQVVEKTAEIPQLHVVGKVVEIPEIQTVQGAQVSESVGTALVLQVAQAEIV